MSTVGNINVVLSANSTNLRSQLTAAARDVETFTKATETAGASATRAGTLMTKGLQAGALAVGVALAYSVHAAMEFETQMRNVNSISKLSESQFRNLSQQVIDLSTKVPQSATTLAEGLYDIASSGFQGADGLKVLNASAVAASAGMSDTATAAKGITAVLNAYGLQAKDAGYVSDVLFQTVNLGVITFGELATQLGDVVGIAAAAHVSIGEVGAAVAAMTLAGITGAESTTSLNRVIQSIISPSDQLSQLFKNLGYESGYAALQANGLHGTMELLRVATGGNVETLLQLFPEIRAARGAFALMANDGKNYAKTFEEIANKTNVAGATQAAFNEQMKAVSNQIKLFLNQLQAAAIEVGAALLPGVQSLLDGLSELSDFLGDVFLSALDALQPVFQDLTDAFDNVVDAADGVYEAVEPVVRVLALLAGVAVWGALRAGAKVLEEITGFFAENKAAAITLGVIVGTVLVSKFLTLAAAIGTFAKAQVFAAMTPAIQAVGQSLYGLQLGLSASEGALAKLAFVGSSAFDGLKAAIASPVVPLAILTLAIIGIGQAMQEGQQQSQEFVKGLEKNLNRESLNSYVDTIDSMTHAFERLSARAKEQSGSFVEVGKAVLDMVVPFTDIHDTLFDTEQAGKATGEELKVLQDQYTKLYNGLVEAARGSEAFKREMGSGWDTSAAMVDRAKAGIDALNKSYIDGKIGPTEYKAKLADFNEILSRQQPVVAEHEKRMRGILQTYLDFAKAQKIEIPDPSASAATWDKWGTALHDAYIASQGLAPNNDSLRTSLQVLGSDLSSTTDKLKAYEDALKEVLGAPLDLRQAQADLGDSLRGLSGALTENGFNFDVWSEGGSKVQKSMKETKDNILDLVGTIGAQQGLPAATATFDEWVGRVKDAARASGATEEQVDQLITTMGLTPDQIAIAIALADPQGAQKKVEDLDKQAQDAMKHSDLKYLIQVDGFDDAVADMQGVQIQWQNSAGQMQTGTVLAGKAIKATLDDANTAAKGFQVTVTALDGTTSTVTIATNAKDVQPEVDGVQKLVQNMDGTVSIVTLKADDQASGTVDGASGKVDEFGNKKPKPTLDADPNDALANIAAATNAAAAYGYLAPKPTLSATDNASGVIQPVVSLLGNVTDRHATVTVDAQLTAAYQDYLNRSGGNPAAYYSADGNIFLANGGGIRHFAGGSENHVAQIARAGAWRVWAEPETGGEAYIPLAPRKRGRSTNILSEVAKQFGYGLHRMADGGTTAAGAPVSQSQVVQISTEVNWNAPIYGDAGIKRAVEQMLDDRDRQLSMSLRRGRSAV